MQHVPKIVQARLQRSTPEAAPAHPGADLLTAFAEQSLGDSERTRVMDHLAGCGDCREVVALSLPATEAVTVSRSTSGARAAWLSWPVLRWGVVTAGIALVTSVGILRYSQRTEHNAALVGSAVRQEEKVASVKDQPSAPAAQASVPRAAEIAKQTPSRKLSRSQAAATADQPSPSPNLVFPPSQPTGSGTGGGMGGGVFRAGGTGSGSGQAPKSSQGQPQTNGLALAPPAKETAPAPSQNPTAQPAPAAPDRVLVSGATQVVEVQSETAQIAAQNQVGGQLAQNQTELPSQKQPLKNLDVVKAKDSLPQQAQSSVAFAPTVSTPNISLRKELRASPRWAISSSGALQRSFDAGSTWEDVNVSQAALTGGARMESTANRKDELKDKSKKSDKGQSSPSLVFRAVAAIDPEVWAGGSGAMLYHSLDSGTHWTRVLPSEATASLTGDVINVEFSDAQHGRVATSTGEVWFTADDGQTWHKQ